MSCEGWKTVKLGDVSNFQNGFAFKSKDFVIKGNTKVIKIKELKNGNIKFFNDTATVNLQDSLEQYKIYNNDLLIALTGDPVSKSNPLSWVGRVALYRHKEISYLNQRVCKLLPYKNELDNIYLYYYFRQHEQLYNLASKATGSASQANISTKIISNTEISLPPLPEQKAIASVLSALDDKIELNNKINKNLEEMAQAIFKSWFVDFEPFKDSEFVDSELGRIPKGWRVGTLGEIADITMGQSPKGSSYNEEKNGALFFQGRAEFGWRYPTPRLYTTEPKRIAKANDVLMSVRAPVGDINVARQDCCIGRGLSAIRSNNNCASFLLYTILNLKKELNVFNGQGTVFGSINRNSLNNMKVIIPPNVITTYFEELVSSIDSMIKSNCFENSNLQQLRDTLLPKLMSGEIRVPVEAG